MLSNHSFIMSAAVGGLAIGAAAGAAAASAAQPSITVVV